LAVKLIEEAKVPLLLLVGAEHELRAGPGKLGAAALVHDLCLENRRILLLCLLLEPLALTILAVDGADDGWDGV